MFKDTIAAIKKAETTTVEYHKWTARIALAQHNGTVEPDHDIRKGPKPPRKKRDKKPITANDQAILNRMPFARRSLGISVWQGPTTATWRAPTMRLNNATRLFQLCQRQNFNRTGIDASLELAYLADAPFVDVPAHRLCSERAMGDLVHAHRSIHDARP